MSVSSEAVYDFWGRPVRTRAVEGGWEISEIGQVDGRIGCVFRTPLTGIDLITDLLDSTSVRYVPHVTAIYVRTGGGVGDPHANVYRFIVGDVDDRGLHSIEVDDAKGKIQRLITDSSHVIERQVLQFPFVTEDRWPIAVDRSMSIFLEGLPWPIWTSAVDSILVVSGIPATADMGLEEIGMPAEFSRMREEVCIEAAV